MYSFLILGSDLRYLYLKEFLLSKGFDAEISDEYKEGFDYEQFVLITDEKEAAYVFAVCYERCNPIYHEVRQRHATTAYNYYVDKT